jgi:hypothetical protein
LKTTHPNRRSTVRFSGWLVPPIVFLHALLSAGCATTTSETRVVDISVTAPEGQVLSNRQLEVVLALIGPQLASQGIQIATAKDQAREILLVRFTPDPLAKDGGHISILGVQPKPRKLLTTDPATAADQVVRQSGPD